MKKENRKAAQQRRAEERRKLEMKKKRKKILSWVLPILAVILLFLLVIFGENLFSGKDSSTDTSSDSSASSSSEQPSDDSSDASSDSSTSSSESTGYSTDASLTIKDGDTVNIDYVGSVDGTEFAGGSTDGNGTDLTIGSGLYIDDFEEQLIGHHPGDQVDVNVTFPEDYSQEDLQGKDALFQVTINGIYTD